MTQYQIVSDTDTVLRDGTLKLHGPQGFEGMRRAGRLAAETLDALVPLVVPGVTTGELDDFVREFTLAAGAVPATLGYRGYAHSCCISINHVVCHGIPSDKPLKDGDIVNIDVTPLLDDGWTAVTRDRSLSAQFEHSIGITETGCEIFTLSPKGLHQPPY